MTHRIFQEGNCTMDVWWELLVAGGWLQLLQTCLQFGQPLLQMWWATYKQTLTRLYVGWTILSMPSHLKFFILAGPGNDLGLHSLIINQSLTHYHAYNILQNVKLLAHSAPHSQWSTQSFEFSRLHKAFCIEPYGMASWQHHPFDFGSLIAVAILIVILTNYNLYSETNMSTSSAPRSESQDAQNLLKPPCFLCWETCVIAGGWSHLQISAGGNLDTPSLRDHLNHNILNLKKAEA